MTNSALLKAKIEQKGLTYAEIANIIDISTCSFSKKINGVRDFTVNEMSKLCDVLDIQDKVAVFFA